MTTPPEPVKTTQTSADKRDVKAIFVEGPHAGQTARMADELKPVISVAPRWSLIRSQLPEPPWWHLLAHRAWRRDPYGKHYVKREQPPLPPEVYRYAGTLDDGTRVYRFDAVATWGTIALVRQ